MKIKKGFTLLELLVVVALIAIIATVAIVLFNPFQQIGKAYDVKRKHDLAQLQKAMEDYYNDKGCYPKPSQICYDVPPPPINICGSGVGGNKPLVSQTCHICGNESTSPSFSPYLSKFPCDPQHKQKQYLYEVTVAPGFLCSTVDPTAVSACPQWYRVYSNLSIQADAASKELGCQGGGCGTAPGYGYDYGTTSPNEKLSKTPQYVQYTTSFTCDNCTGMGADYENCKLYIYPRDPKNIYPSKEKCCLIQPKPIGCP